MGLVDLLFPRTCLGCGRLGSYVCEDCLNKLELIKIQKCPMCEKPTVTGMVHPRCRQPKVGMEGVTSVLAYKGLTRKLIAKLKFGMVTDLYDSLIELVVTFGDFRLISRNDWLVVAIPLHASRERWRGFNQAEGLAARLATYMGWQYMAQALVRLKKTEVQQRLTRENRQENVKGAFGLNPWFKPDSFKKKKVLLVDDVWTTGATMRECARILKRAEVVKVWGLTLAT